MTQTLSRLFRGALIDRGANGGIVGSDAVVIKVHQRQVDVTGIDNHELNSLKIVDASAKVMSNRGWVIVIMRQYAYHGIRTTIHSAAQIESYKNFVDDKSQKVGGRQCIKTLEGYILPLDIISGLPYLKMQPNTKEEFDTLPHVFLTSDEDWDPTVLDNVITDRDDWQNTLHDLDEGFIHQPFDEYGNYSQKRPESERRRSKRIKDRTLKYSGEVHSIKKADLRVCFHEVCNLNAVYVPGKEGSSDELIDARNHPVKVKPSDIDYKAYSPYFLSVPVEKIRKTFERTTRFASNILAGQKITQLHKAPNPAFNVWRRNEPVATDTVYAQQPSYDGGYTMAQIFVGRKSLVVDVFGMTNESQFVHTLEDVIKKRGAMDKLISDGASTEISRKVQDVLRALFIKAWQSERDKQEQQYSENRWKTVKGNTQWTMKNRDIPPAAWFLCLEWVGDVMNHTAEKSLGWRPPLEVLTGQTIDISKLLYFVFWDRVAVSRHEDNTYSGQIGSKKSSEIQGRFVGFSWNVGHAMTFKILTDDTKRVICRSRIRLLDVPENHIKVDREFKGTAERTFLTSVAEDEHGNIQMPTIDMSKNPFVDTDEPGADQKECRSEEQGTSSPSPSRKDGASVQKENVQDVPSPQGSENETQSSSSVPKEKGEPEPAAASQEASPWVPVVETVTESDDEGEGATVENDNASYTSPMDSGPLREEEEPKLVDRYQYDSDSEFGDSDSESDDELSVQSENDNIEEEPRLEDHFDPMETVNLTEPGRLEPDQLIDRTFLMPPSDDGSRVRAKIVKRVRDFKKGREDDPDYIKFKCLVNGEYEEVMAYNDIVDYIEQDQTWDGIWKFKNVLKIVGPVRRNSKLYRGSRYSCQVEWETGEITWEPLVTKDGTGIWDSDPVTVAIFARQNGLIDQLAKECPGIRKYCKTQKRIVRLANQAKLRSFRTKPVYMFGVLVPRNYQQAVEIDKENGNTKWQDCTSLELKQIDDYATFVDKGRGYIPGPGWKKINVHLVYAVKHDGRYKARLVAGGHLTDTPIDSVYSSVVSLRGIRILVFLGEHNDCLIWATDIGNAYLESFTKEKVYIKAGPEFGDREGHILIISKALYGLKSSGLRWHERLADVLRDMGFVASRAEQDIWMCDKGDHYEYIGVYVDDLIIVSRTPQDIIHELEVNRKFKLKGTGAIEFHLGCDFFRDEDGVLCYAPYKYITRMMDNYKRIYGQNPKQATSPLTKGDHPEIDTSDLLDIEGIKIYQSLIGSLQWVVQIGRFDVCTAVMTMSRFRAAPRDGHLERVKRIIGYLSKMRFGKIRVLTDEPDFTAFPDQHFEWTNTCYHGAKEVLPHDAPRPLGKRVICWACKDSNLYHCVVSGRSVTGILMFLNKTPVDWYSKLQATVETATFGSEYVAARTCTDQIIDMRNTLRYLGVPVEGPSYMFGDNESVVNTAALPEGRLLKRHNALSYHRTREAIAAKILRFYHIAGKLNPADILSKHWDYPSIWAVLRPLMFWTGDTADLSSAVDTLEATEEQREHSGGDKQEEE